MPASLAEEARTSSSRPHCSRCAVHDRTFNRDQFDRGIGYWITSSTRSSSDGAIVRSSAGIVPSLVLATLLGLTTWWRAREFDYPRQPPASWPERLRTFRESIWGRLLIVVVIGGIYTGVFTPTEAAAMSAVCAFLVAVFVYKDMRLSQVRGCSSTAPT